MPTRPGLAKGTVYLYFPSKEELLLAVHERGIDGFFRALIALARVREPVSIEPMLVLTHRHIVGPPLFLPLASRCFGLMAHSLPPEVAAAFKQRMAARLERAGAGLERHFPGLPAGGGVALLPPQLRPDPRPLADVAVGGGRLFALRDKRAGSVACLRLELSRPNSMSRCARCGKE